jgi:proteasome accessory factor B
MAARRTERLLEVVLCLSQTRTYVTKAQLREAIEDYARSPNEIAFERTFERDKADLRDLGVPLETAGDGGDEGYRIDLRSAALPAVTFTPEEAAVLGLARRLWHADGAAAADRALRKLEASGVAVDNGALAAVEPRLIGGEQAYAPLAEAASRRRAVTFQHRRSGATGALARHLQPWGLLSRSGRWYVVGHDLDRSEPRAFRLDRIVGPVVPQGPDGAYVVPPDVDVGTLVQDPVPGSGGDARLLVRADRGHELRDRASSIEPTNEPAGYDLLQITYVDADRLAHQVLEHGADVLVVEPAFLRANVLAALNAVAAGA